MTNKKAKAKVSVLVPPARNRVRCLHCNDIIESLTVHDFQTCMCGKVIVDGGRDYMRRVYPASPAGDHYEEMP